LEMASKLADTRKEIRISYAGALTSRHTFEKSIGPDSSSLNLLSKARRLLQTWQNNNIDWSTRSGYYFLRGLGKFKDEHPELAKRLKVHLWGSIDKKNIALASELGLNDIVQFDGFIDHKRTLELLDKSDYVLLPLESRLQDSDKRMRSKANEEPLHIPGKLYEYLAAERNILLLAEQSDCREIAEKAGLAVSCDPRDREEISNALVQITSEPQKLVPNKEYISNYSYESIGKRLISVIKGLE